MTKSSRITLALALCAFFSLAPASAGVQLTLIVDGQVLGTLAGDGVQYDALAGEVRITTREIVWGCRTDFVFIDQFED